MMWAPSLTCSMSTATQTGTYTVVVTRGGCTATSNAITLTNCTTGIVLENGAVEAESDRVEEEEGAAVVLGTEEAGTRVPSFVLYPNPTTGVVNMVVNDPDASVFEVMDLMGRNVLRGRYTPVLDASVLPSGAYVVLIKAFDGKPLAHARLVRE